MRISRSLGRTGGRDDLPQMSAGERDRDEFIASLTEPGRVAATDYLNMLTALDRKVSARGSAWMQAVVDEITGKALSALPSFRD